MYCLGNRQLQGDSRFVSLARWLKSTASNRFLVKEQRLLHSCQLDRLFKRIKPQSRDKSKFEKGIEKLFRLLVLQNQSDLSTSAKDRANHE